MIIHEEGSIDSSKELVATIGFFDGVHCGHRHLIHHITSEAREKGMSSAVITFKEHPRKVVNSTYHPALLTLHEEKMEHLDDTGVDYCVSLHFTAELSRLTAYEFMRRVLVEQLRVKVLYIGHDHRFGRDRASGFDEYVAWGAELGIEIRQAPLFRVGEDAISSSYVRRALLAGDVERAATALGYPYRMRGLVVEGFKIGRTISFPTANLLLGSCDKLIPRTGVYIVSTWYEGLLYWGMMNIGNRPTVHDQGGLSIEVHLFDFDKEIYGEYLEVSILAFLREERKMNGLEELKLQLGRDRALALAWMEEQEL
ncbi:MAG: riboflavin biosynthesis protein RibF [Bacteroidales bacterium]